MVWWLWLWSVALGQPAVGIIDLQVSPSTEVVQFPRVDATRVDLALYGNRVDLDMQLDGRSTRHLRQAWAESMGGGTWFMTLHVASGDIDIGTALDGSKLRIRLEPGRAGAPALPPNDRPTVESLLVEPPPRRPASPPTLTLHPLLGDASTMRMTPVRAFSGMPKVRTPEVATYRSSLAAIDSYRDVWRRAEGDPKTQAAALARIAVAYSNLDLHRDALHYFHRALDMGRSDAALALAMARTQVAMDDAAGARSSCRYAHRRGAEPADVLACLAGAALVDGVPSPSHTARALAGVANTPHHQLLAAQLLQSDHRHQEALPLLERLAETGDAAVYGSLGDARYMVGDIEGAVAAWRGAARRRSLRDRSVLRMRMAEWAKEGPSGLPQAVPLLLALTDRSDAVASEAHYLLVQIGTVHADPDLIAEQATQLWDADPRRTLRSDVPERLVSTCTFRMGQLADRPVEALDFFARCWRPALEDMVTDPTPLEVASRSMASLGLPEDALRLQLRAMTLRTRSGQDDPLALAWLADLHLRTGRPDEALDTLRYVRSLPTRAPGVDDVLLRVEGDAYEAKGDVAAALAAWERVDDAAPVGAEARQRRGELLARKGRCAEALPLLSGIAAATLTRSRCLLREGRAEEARAVLDALEGADELLAADALWLSAVAAWREGASVESVDGVWAALLAEESRATAFDARARIR